MREYSKVGSRFWTAGTGKALRGDLASQVLALYLMTCSHATMIGVFHCPVVYMAHETGMTIEEASKALARLIDAGFCTFDEGDDVVWVHAMAAYQIGSTLSANDKQVIGIRKQFDAIRQTEIRRGFWARYREVFHLPELVETASPIEAPSMPLRSQEQEQEQESSGADAPVVAGKPADACPHQEIIDLYHRILPMGRQVRVWNEARRAKLRARWREDDKRQSLDWWERFFGYIAESEFLTGQTTTAGRPPFEIDLEWIVTPAKFVKIVEGAYHRCEVAA